jgi:hypothetical protein
LQRKPEREERLGGRGLGDLRGQGEVDGHDEVLTRVVVEDVLTEDRALGSLSDQGEHGFAERAQRLGHARGAKHRHSLDPPRLWAARAESRDPAA